MIQTRDLGKPILRSDPIADRRPQRSRSPDRRSLPDLRDTSAPSEAQDDLLRFLTQRLEFHFEQRLKTAAVLSQL